MSGRGSFVGKYGSVEIGLSLLGERVGGECCEKIIVEFMCFIWIGVGCAR